MDFPAFSKFYTAGLLSDFDLRQHKSLPLPEAAMPVRCFCLETTTIKQHGTRLIPPRTTRGLALRRFEPFPDESGRILCLNWRKVYGILSSNFGEVAERPKVLAC